MKDILKKILRYVEFSIPADIFIATLLILEALDKRGTTSYNIALGLLILNVTGGLLSYFGEKVK